jgi:AraC-like DNA-binding protein
MSSSARSKTPLLRPTQGRLSVRNPVQVSQSAGLKYADPVVSRSSVLAGLVDGMGDWDIACPDQAQALTIKAIPHSAPLLLIQYRTPILFTWQFGSYSFRQPDCRHFATKLHTGVVIARPRGPVGMIAVRLKSWAILGEHMRHLLDAQIGLDDLFSAGQVSLLEEMLSEAKTSADRFACVEKFLLANLRPRQAEPVASRAAALLARNHHLRVRQLAARLDTSERHLSRNFRAVFGICPKQFIRTARIERVLLTRARGATWAEIAHATGFTDQAHMINDFTEIVGVSPGQFLQGVTGQPASNR